MKTLKELIGKKIVKIRPLNKEDREREGWPEYGHEATSVIILEGGIEIFPSQDDEGNGPGTLFGRDKKGSFYVFDKEVIE